MKRKKSSANPTPVKGHKHMKRHRKKLTINVYWCRYQVVRDIAKELFKFRVQEHESDDHDIFWSDTGFGPDRL